MSFNTGAVIQPTGDCDECGPGCVGVLTGVGTPQGVVTANIGTLYTRIDGGAGTTLYVKESGSGNTGWVAK